jgi:uncharacterized membrane protein
MTGPAEPIPAAAPPPAAPPPAAPRRRRGLWIALIASIMVNVFVVGWVAASWVYGPRFVPGSRFGPTAAPGLAFNHRRAAHALSGSERETAERIWRENLAELQNRARAMRQAHINMRTAFAADQADAKAIGDAVTALKEKASAVFDHANAALLKIATTLPPESRKAYFNAGFPRPRERDREREPRRERENR